MWILKVDDNKAQAYKNLLYQYTGLAFDKQTKLKKNDIGFVFERSENMKQSVVLPPHE